MKNLILKTLLLSSLLFAFTNCEVEVDKDSDEEIEETSGLMINLTSDPTEHPHSALMGLHLAQNALKNEVPVTVFLNVSGVKLMAPGADTITFHDENLHDLLKDIMEKGGEVLACPHCMEVMNVSEVNLLDGVKVSGESIMFAKIKDNPTVFTY